MRTVLALILGAVIGAILVLGVMLLLAEDPITRGLDRDQRPSSITTRQFRNLDRGASQDEVEERLGESATAEEFESGNLARSEPETASCVYYNRRGGGLGEVFRLCFSDGRLVSKRRL